MFVPTCVRIWVPPPQEAEQEAQALHSRPDGQELPLQDWDCFLMQVPLLPRLSHGTLLLLSVVPVPQDTEHEDQVLQGSDTGRGACEGLLDDGKPIGGDGVVKMSTGQEEGQ